MTSPMAACYRIEQQAIPASVRSTADKISALTRAPRARLGTAQPTSTSPCIPTPHRISWDMPALAVLLPLVWSATQRATMRRKLPPIPNGRRCTGRPRPFLSRLALRPETSKRRTVQPEVPPSSKLNSKLQRGWWVKRKSSQRALKSWHPNRSNDQNRHRQPHPQCASAGGP